MREIGGYFELEEYRGREFHRALALNTARNALVYLIRASGIRKIYLPYYLCDTVGDVCVSEGLEPEFYRLGVDFLPETAGWEEDGYLYLVNYFGLISNETIQALQKVHARLIVDNVQAFFRRPVSGVDTIYSCRKYFGVPDGAYLYTEAEMLPEEEPAQDESRDRVAALLGRYEKSGAAYYGCYQNQCMAFRMEPLKRMSRLTHNLLRGIDYDWVRERRNRNYRQLHSMLGKSGAIAPEYVDGAFAYPFWCPQGQEVRRALAEKRIYVPLLWPNVPAAVPETWREAGMALNILPLPCDQRYDAGDMSYMAEQLKGLLRRREQDGNLWRTYQAEGPGETGSGADERNAERSGDGAACGGLVLSGIDGNAGVMV